MFRTFRKNKKTWLATLGVLAMFSFVFIPAFQEGAGYRYGSAKSKVVSTNLGSLNEMDLNNLRVERQTFVAFLNALAGAFMQDYATLQDAAMKAGDVAENPMLPKLQEYSRVVQKLRILEQRLSRTDETSLVNDWLQARYAEKAGIVINNETIADFVKSLTSGLATAEQLQLAVEQIRLTNPQQLDDSIRELLLGSEYRRLFAANFKEMPLSKQWDYFCRVYKSATVDAFAVPVMDYVEKVPAPTEGELLAYFDTHKNEYSDGDLGKPGFKERKKARIEMMFANVEKFAKPDEVTDAAIAAEYERVKATEFVKRPGVDLPGVELPNMTENPFSDNAGETIQPETLPEDAAPVTEEKPEALPETVEIPDLPATEEPAPAPAENAPAVEEPAP
ncbi:MAG: hypothetical protein Q4D62_09125, partial [Planctomycetia bacterium]|nr:hypothetical protein [Planctomycetia bacterium]